MKKTTTILLILVTILVMQIASGCATQRRGCPAHSGDHYMSGY